MYFANKVSASDVVNNNKHIAAEAFDYQAAAAQPAYDLKHQHHEHCVVNLMASLQQELAPEIAARIAEAERIAAEAEAEAAAYAEHAAAVQAEHELKEQEQHQVYTLLLF